MKQSSLGRGRLSLCFMRRVAGGEKKANKQSAARIPIKHGQTNREVNKPQQGIRALYLETVDVPLCLPLATHRLATRTVCPAVPYFSVGQKGRLSRRTFPSGTSMHTRHTSSRAQPGQARKPIIGQHTDHVPRPPLQSLELPYDHVSANGCQSSDHTQRSTQV